MFTIKIINYIIDNKIKLILIIFIIIFIIIFLIIFIFLIYI